METFGWAHGITRNTIRNQSNMHTRSNTYRIALRHSQLRLRILNLHIHLLLRLDLHGLTQHVRLLHQRLRLLSRLHLLHRLQSQTLLQSHIRLPHGPHLLHPRLAPRRLLHLPPLDLVTLPLRHDLLQPPRILPPHTLHSPRRLVLQHPHPILVTLLLLRHLRLKRRRLLQPILQIRRQFHVGDFHVDDLHAVRLEFRIEGGEHPHGEFFAEVVHRVVGDAVDEAADGFFGGGGEKFVEAVGAQFVDEALLGVGLCDECILWILMCSGFR
mmetsp:Transcript_7523/g.15772  ORF Transcript_7523/g.15772 Transcript_7523/m.15772 type:complete len:270 (-) Transcript_7523:611-1420(-)